MPEARERAAGHDEAERIPAEIWIILAATFFVAIGFGLIVPVLPQFAASFAVDSTAVGVVVSAFAFMRLVSAPGAGAAVNRFGEQRTYATGLLIVAASSLASAFARDYWQLLIFRALGGIGSVMFTVAASGLVIRYSPEALRGRISAMWGGTFLIGNIAGPAIGGVLGQLGLRIPFIVYAVALAVAAAIIAFSLHRPASRGGAAPDRGPKGEPLRVREVLGDSAYRASMISGFAAGWSNFGVRSAVVPLFVAAAVSPEPWAAGVVVAVAAVGNVLALQFAGKGSDRRGRRPYLIVGLLVAALGLLATPIAHELPVLLAISFVGGVGSGLAAPAQQAAVGDLVGRKRSGGQVLSSLQMTQDVGTIAGPIVAGIIIDHVGYGWAFAASAAVLVVGALAWLPAREPRRA
ncbi:Tetracycline resistance protein, class C [Pseudoclavibacter triregionum]|nr:Tetracycline resistance protein, class C [Pseudoclavibacter triregionum]